MVSYTQEGSGKRARRARNSLSRDEIVAASRTVLRDGGIEAFTVRAVAAELGASAMALYNHLPSKEAILDATLDALLGELNLVDDPSRPAAEMLVEHAERQLALLRVNRWAIPALFRRPDPGLGAAAVGEAYLATAIRGSADSQTAVDVFTAIIATVYGAAGFLTSDGESQQSRDDVAAAIAQVPLPATRSVATQLAAYGDDAQLHRILTAVITGLLPDPTPVPPRS